jgi:glycosyltransferase involved in cell wall biosynthesis
MALECGHFAVFTKGCCGMALTNVSVYLASGIALQGHTVDMVTLNTPEADLLRFYRHVNGFSRVNVYPLEARHTKTSVPALITYYRTREPDVMFSQLTYTNAFAVVAKHLSFTKTINIFLEGTIISKVGAIDSRKDFKLKLVPLLVKIFYPYAGGVVAKSHDVLRDLKVLVGRRLRRVKVTVLPNPYDIERIRLLAQEPVDHPWLANNPVPVIIAAGRLWEQKGFDILVRAFAEVLNETSCRLLILGEGPEHGALEALVEDLRLADAVSLPGRVDNPWKYMSRASIFILPSRWEGWPSALMEAMACGLPVIATDCPGGGKEMVENGVSGLIVPTEDVKALTMTILQLLKDRALRTDLSQHALRRSQNFDYRIVAQDYISFAESLIESYAKGQIIT